MAALQRVWQATVWGLEAASRRDMLLDGSVLLRNHVASQRNCRELLRFRQSVRTFESAESENGDRSLRHTQQKSYGDAQ
jgi:hypothetical protein